MGIALAEVFSPAGDETAGLLRRLFHILAVVLFLAIGGHRMLISALVGTFRTVPLRGFAPGQAVLTLVGDMLAASFVLGLKVAVPVLIAMLLATVGLGMLQKTIPQCNLLSTNLPVRAMLGMFVLTAGLAAMPWLIETAVGVTGRHISAFVRGL